MILTPYDHPDDEEYYEKNTNMFAELIQFLDGQNLMTKILMTLLKMQKSTANLERMLFIKRKAENNFLIY